MCSAGRLCRQMRGRLRFRIIPSLISKRPTCHAAASFLCGLPEQKIRKIELRNVDISFAEQAREGVPAMMEGVSCLFETGFTVMNVDTLVCENVTLPVRGRRVYYE